MGKREIKVRDWIRINKGAIDNENPAYSPLDYPAIIEVDEGISKWLGQVLVDKGTLTQSLAAQTESIVGQVSAAIAAAETAGSIADLIGDIVVQGIADAIIQKIVDALVGNAAVSKADLGFDQSKATLYDFVQQILTRLQVIYEEMETIKNMIPAETIGYGIFQGTKVKREE
jgi:hypothetical protein